MSKVKIPRKSTWQDMTAMTDVAFLLLTFFMLTTSFTKKEPISVAPPSCISEIKIPETNIVKLIVNKEGKIFFDTDGQQQRMDILKEVGQHYNVKFTDEELKKFSMFAGFGVPISQMKSFLALPSEERDKEIYAIGIPIDTVKASPKNEFKEWMKAARNVKGMKMVIAIKADANTAYPKIKAVMNTLQDIKENRFNLITNLEENPIK